MMYLRNIFSEIWNNIGSNKKPSMLIGLVYAHFEAK